MEQRRLAPLVGIAGNLAVAVSLALPYLVVRSSPGTAVATYYGTGAINPLIAGVLALVGTIVLAAGREERTDPIVAAGVSLSLGAFVCGLLALWAVTVPVEVVVGIDGPTSIQHHRWATTTVAAIVPVASAWWARTLGLV
jgi:hypothetical protein